MDHSTLSEHQLEQITLIFKALSDPTRVKILHKLAQEECSVSKLSEILQLSQSATSHQLSYLKSIRLVKSKRNGNSILYSCDDDHVISLLKQAIEHSSH